MERRDHELLEAILFCERGIQSGYGTWLICETKDKRTYVSTRAGRREAAVPYEALERRLEEKEAALRGRGLGAYDLDDEIVRWLDREFPPPRRSK